MLFSSDLVDVKGHLENVYDLLENCFSSHRTIILPSESSSPTLNFSFETFITIKGILRKIIITKHVTMSTHDFEPRCLDCLHFVIH